LEHPNDSVRNGDDHAGIVVEVNGMRFGLDAENRRFRPLVNPYTLPAGFELDALIHYHVMGEATRFEHCPRYSTEIRAAKKVRARMRWFYRTVVTSGRTNISERPWFARVVAESDRGTEVIAESLPLAICRLALVRVCAQAPLYADEPLLPESLLFAQAEPISQTAPV
jgi:hypothetical protein